jgi:dTDP-4-amino-4,6-dideoxygalactose transaminase
MTYLQISGVFMKIAMLDLIAQQKTIEAELHGAVQAVIASASYLPSGAITPFEADFARYCGRAHAVGVSSGTAAIQLALLAAGVGAGDDVITVPNSFFATTEAILHVGARPIFCDIDRSTHLMNPDLIPALLSERTKAILPVHLYGNVVDIVRLRRLLDQSGFDQVRIIEDCAHAIGARRGGKPVPLGGIGAFSFNPGKNIGALSDAGAIVTDDDAISSTVCALRDHGRTGKTTHASIGFNSRLSTLNERVLSVKLRVLDSWNAHRRRVAARYDAAFGRLSEIELVSVADDVQHAYHQYVVRAERRDGLQLHLARAGIASSIHYPTLISDQPPMREIGYDSNATPVAKSLNATILSLPCHPQLSDADVEAIIDAVEQFCHDGHAAEPVQALQITR